MSACATLPRNPIPADRAFDAEIDGIPGARAWGGIVSEDFMDDLVLSRKQESPGQFAVDDDGWPIYDMLALSGGGATGAFGAGFLNGWSETGERPDFKLVSGISTGALIAPLAFLGAQQDELLKSVFTSVETENILEKLSLFAIIFRSESVATTGPLKALIDQFFDEEFLQKVAQRHNQGYRLYIGTHHMDAQRLVVWNMGLIANSSHPDAPELFRNIVLASASIPVVFPPVMIDSVVDGETYDEMHVDGGVSVQVFINAGTFDVPAALAAASGLGEKEVPVIRGNVYIIRNGQLSSSFQEIPRELGRITARALDSMIKISSVGDLYRIYSFSQRGNFGFYYSSVPDDYVANSQEPFDRAEMNRLFEIGFEQGASGEAWRTTPPGFN